MFTEHELTSVVYSTSCAQFLSAWSPFFAVAGQFPSLALSRRSARCWGPCHLPVVIVIGAEWAPLFFPCHTPPGSHPSLSPCAFGLLLQRFLHFPNLMGTLSPELCFAPTYLVFPLLIAGPTHDFHLDLSRLRAAFIAAAVSFHRLPLSGGNRSVSIAIGYFVECLSQ